MISPIRISTLIALIMAVSLAVGVANAGVFGPLFSGSSQIAPPSGTAPVVTSLACTIALPVTNGVNVNLVGGGTCAYTATCASAACAGQNVITAWHITAQSTANSYSITNAGILQGGSSAGSVTTGSYTVTVTATNSTGTSPGVVQSISVFQPPVVASLACSIKSPITNNTNVTLQAGGNCQYTATCGGGACSGGNAISSWAVTADTCAGCYQVTNAGILQGSTNAGAVTNTTSTVTVIATNAGGNSPGVAQTVTAVTVPAIVNQNFSATLPLTNGQTIGTMVASPTPTSWAITAVSGGGASTSDFSINSSGVITTTSSAPTDITNPATIIISMTATNASGTSPTGTGTLTINNGTCPKGTSFPDGCPAAPPGSPQAPTLLSGGAYSGQSWTTRPPWNVAAVDYPVASIAGITTHCGSLTPWTTVTTPGTSISGANFFISGNNVSLTCIDFTTSNGAQVLVSGSNDSITWSSMNYGTALQGISSSDVLVQTGGSNLTLNYNVIDGNCVALGPGHGATNQGTLISFAAGSSGTATLMYNLFSNFRQHVIEDQSNNTVIRKYNYVLNGGSCDNVGGPHLNYQQGGNNNGTQHLTIDFETTYQPTQPQAGGEGYQCYSNAGSGNAITVCTVANNTMIFGPNGEGTPHIATSNNSSICTSGCVSEAQVFGNYIDRRGGGGFFFPDPNACPAGTPPQQNVYGAACSSGNASNINPVTGATITTTP